MKDWKTLSSEIVYKTEFVSLQEDKVVKPDGTKGIYSFLKASGRAVIVVPITKNNEIYLVKLFRYPVKKWSWELPGGVIDANESPRDAAMREFREETGLKAEEFIEIGTNESQTALVDELTYVFLAKNVEGVSPNEQEEEGIIEVKKVPIDEAVHMIRKNELMDGQTITSLLQVLFYLGYSIKK